MLNMICIDFSESTGEGSLGSYLAMPILVSPQSHVDIAGR